MAKLNKITEEMHSEIIRLYESGMGTGQIGLKLKVSADGCVRLLRKLGKIRDKHSPEYRATRNKPRGKQAKTDYHFEKEHRLKIARSLG